MATERTNNDEPILVLRADESLIGVVSRTDDGFVEQIFANEDGADAVVDDDIVQSALLLAGAWSDLDWDDMVEELDRIRHSNPPSPPLSI
jgi:hypothetical protein